MKIRGPQWNEWKEGMNAGVVISRKYALRHYHVSSTYQAFHKPRSRPEIGWSARDVSIITVSTHDLNDQSSRWGVELQENPPTKKGLRV